METSSIAQKYLDRILKFKANHELHDSYLEEKDREKLIEQLLDSLGFEKKLCDQRKSKAYKYWLQAEIHDEDEQLKKLAPRVHQYFRDKYLLKAISLDPFNEEYLKTYKKAVEKNFTVTFVDRLMSLHHPNSTDYQNLMVDLGVSNPNLSFDYLDENITNPLVNEMVFMQEENAITNQKIESEKQLKKLARDGGVDDRTLDQIHADLPNHIKNIERIFGVFGKNWDDAQKAWLSVNVALDIAPFNSDVLEVAIAFFGHSHWRLIMNYSKFNRHHPGQKAYIKLVTGKEKIDKETQIAAARQSLEKANELYERYRLVLSKKPKEKKDSWQSRIPMMGNLSGLLREFGIYNRQQDLRPFFDALLDKEDETQKIFIDHLEFNGMTNIIGFSIGITLSLIVGYMCFFVFPYFGFLPMFLVAVIAFGALHLREIWWQRNVSPEKP